MSDVREKLAERLWILAGNLTPWAEMQPGHPRYIPSQWSDRTVRKTRERAAEILSVEVSSSVTLGDAVRDHARLTARVAELERVLRLVKADRPSAHSDDVWAAILAATEAPDADA